MLALSQVSAQDCHCLTSEVMSNAVQPCEIVVGTVVTVSTTSELQSAIGQANSSGGQMTILIEDGTYAVASTASYPYITVSDVVFRSASGNRDAVIITGQGMADVAPGTEIGFYAVGDNITIADLTIRGVGNHGIAVTGDGLLVHNVRIQDTFEQMVKGNSAGDGADNGRVQCSLFEYTAGIGPQWYIGGLDIHQGDDWVVSDNVFYDIASPSQTLAEHAVHFWDNSANNTVERNIIVGCDRGIGFGLGASPNTGGIIRNNMIYNDGGDPFDDVGIGLESSPGTKVYNNSIMVDYQNAIEYRFESTTGAHIVNNVTNRPITSRNGGQGVLETNVETLDPMWFVSPEIGDFRLQPDIGILMDQGTALDVDLTDDIDKTPRAMGTGIDIGAHEFMQPNSLTEVGMPSLRLFPMPARDRVNIDISERQSGNSVHIYDAVGRLVLTKSLDGESQQVISIAPLTEGVYTLRLISSAGQTEATAPLVVVD